MIDDFYKELFLKGQENGNYQMFTFDIKNSKQMDKSTRYEAQVKIIELIERIYYDLSYLEESLNKQILLHNDTYTNLLEHNPHQDFAVRFEPFILGDVVGLTILKESIPPTLVLEIFNLNKEELEIDFEFHVNYGNYETDDYGLGATISFRGYAVTILSNLHKKDFGITLNHNDEISQDEFDYYMNLISITHEKAVKKAKEYFDSSSDIKTLKKNN